MKTQEKATLEDLYRVEGKAELVNGEIITMSPTGGIPSYAGGEIFAGLRDYARKTHLGYAVTDNAGFIVDLPHRESFNPDVAFYTGKITMKFAQGALIFAVEVRSHGDYGLRAEKKIAQKRADYFAAGTKVVWDVDLLGEDTVSAYHAADPTNPTIYRRGDIANAEPTLPGWSMPVNDLFPV